MLKCQLFPVLLVLEKLGSSYSMLSSGKLLTGTQCPPVLPREGGCREDALSQLWSNCPSLIYYRGNWVQPHPSYPRHIYVSHRGFFQNQGIETRTYKEHLSWTLDKRVFAEFNFFYWLHSSKIQSAAVTVVGSVVTVSNSDMFETVHRRDLTLICPKPIDTWEE